MKIIKWNINNTRNIQTWKKPRKGVHHLLFTSRGPKRTDVQKLAQDTSNMDSTNQFNIFENASKMAKEYTGLEIQGEVIVGSMIAIAVAILVACYFLPPVREAVEEFVQPLVDTFQEAIKEKMSEKQDLISRELAKSIKEL